MGIRVLHVSQPVEAGVAGVVAALLADQCGRGHDVHVASPSGRGLVHQAQRLGAVHHDWPAVRTPGRSVRDETWRLRRIVNTTKPDVLVLHAAKAGLAGRLAVRGQVPTVYVPHAWSFEAVHGALAAAAMAWEVLAGRWTDLAICVSEDERHRGQRVGVPCPMKVIPNGIDLGLHIPRPARAARRALGLPDRPTVVCVGRLVKQKGQDQLLSAWPAVLEAVPEAQLVLVGDGPDRAALEAGAPAGVVFAGNRDDVDEFLAAADAVALPSRWEAMSLALLEAMAAGRPLVAFAVDGVRATVGDAGIVVEPGDVKAMAHALAKLLIDPANATSLGRSARERVSSIGDLRTTLESWDHVLTGLVGGRSLPPEDLRIVPVRTVTRLIAGGGLWSADIATIAGRGRRDFIRAASLSALGIPVWWQGSRRAAPLAWGARLSRAQLSLRSSLVRPRAQGWGRRTDRQ